MSSVERKALSNFIVYAAQKIFVTFASRKDVAFSLRFFFIIVHHELKEAKRARNILLPDQYWIRCVFLQIADQKIKFKLIIIHYISIVYLYSVLGIPDPFLLLNTSFLFSSCFKSIVFKFWSVSFCDHCVTQPILYTM